MKGASGDCVVNPDKPNLKVNCAGSEMQLPQLKGKWLLSPLAWSIGWGKQAGGLARD